MLELTNLRVRSFDLDYLDIFWEVAPTGEDIFDYDLYVERSDHELSGFYTIVGPFKDAYYFRDTTLRGQSSIYRKWYYRIKIVNTRSSGKEEKYFPEYGGVCLTAEPDLAALQMARDFRLRLEEYSGRTCWLFPIRTFGQRCLSCCEPVTGRKLRSNCPVCFDTRWVGGFHRPIEVAAQIILPPEAVAAADLGEIENVNGLMRLSNFPEVQHRWLVVEADNTRWRVGEGIKKVQKGRALVRQELPIQVIPKNSIEYKLPISLTQTEIKNLQASPRRQFTNPQDIGDDIDPEFNLIRQVFQV